MMEMIAMIVNGFVTIFDMLVSVLLVWKMNVNDPVKRELIAMIVNGFVTMFDMLVSLLLVMKMMFGMLVNWT
jgi:hypothetical protein